MSCVPGMPCFQNPSNSEIPCNSQLVVTTNNCGCPPIDVNTTNVIYSGANLTNTLINNLDNITLILSKIDATFNNYVPFSRKLTINGTTFDLSQDRTWNITSGISSLNGLTASTQTFQTNNTGTDFSIVSVGSTHFFAIPTASSTNRGLLSPSDWTTFNNKQGTLTLTTTGTSGAATLISNTLNIPNYTLSGLGGVSTTRNLTINGVTYDLSLDRSWTISAGSPAGSNTQIQFNNAGSFGASANLTYNGSYLSISDGTNTLNYQPTTIRATNNTVGTSITIQAGTVTSGGANGGSIVLSAGENSGTNIGGDIINYLGTSGGFKITHNNSASALFTISNPGVSSYDFQIKSADNNSLNASGGNLTISAGIKTGGGTGHNGYIILSNLPTSSAGLPSGAIWNNSGVVSIV